MRKWQMGWLAASLWLGLSACAEDKGNERSSRGDAMEEDDDDNRVAASARDARSASNPADASSMIRNDASAPPLDAGMLRDASASAMDTSVPMITNDAASASAADAAPMATFMLTSSVVQEGGLIPGMYRCNMPSPPLSWSEGPSGTQSYAIVFQDLVNEYYHWLIYDIPSSTRSLPMGVPVGAMPATPAGAKQGPIYNRSLGFAGPCAPTPNMSRNYAFTLYALSTARLELPANANAMQIVSALEMSSIATTKLTIRSMP